MISGIYQITNTVNGKFYIGSTNNFRLRWGHHRYKLRNNRHQNKHLQASWNKHGEDNFIFSILEYVDDYSELIEREQYWMDILEAILSFNQRDVAGATYGAKASAETRALMSAQRKGMKRSEKAKENYRIAATIREHEKRLTAIPHVEPEWLTKWKASR